ncbi:flagellar basal body-associated FliL family protein [Bacillus cereus group sp. TH152-1LC]|uniref:flagellar basal body-associated FliL family protein n=1 Tax=Bacillus cereus group sp. TH152-1LC TaxID=3018060 RepID=UPI0022E78278|nr:flagellar basal body-associated FliL family protein [Bacillus cereus group sp. TH152-1LC]MDA1675201.1 flagellar basal body-associated FliL family protein [Bacillus cereus group sp. TH152-1LC]
MKKIVIIVIALLVIGGGGFAGWKFFLQKDKGKEETVKVEDLSASELLGLTVKTEGEKGEISTELVDGGRITVAFDVVLENAKAKKELEERHSQMVSTALETLMSKSTEDLAGAPGKQNLELALQKRFGAWMKEGKVIKVFVTKISIS